MSILPCNGLPGICGLRVNDVVFPAVHNAMSSQADGFTGYNNLKSLEDALESGFRAIQIDSCDCDSLGLQICHSECLYFGVMDIGRRDPYQLFANVKNFMDGNPREVIIIDMQVNDNTLDAVYNVLEGVDGFVDMMYSHPSPSTEWPLISELIDSNERIIFFQHNGPNCRNNACPPKIHSTFDHMFDTPYDLDEAELLDYDTSCVVNRGQSGSAFFLSNHFARNGLLPDGDTAENVNQRVVLEDRGAFCEAKLSEMVNIIMVDFWSVGDTIAYANAENNRRVMLNAPVTTESPTSRPSPSPTAEASTEAPTLPPPAPSVSYANAMEAPTSRPSPSPTLESPSAPSVSDSNATELLTSRPSSSPTLESSSAPSVSDSNATEAPMLRPLPLPTVKASFAPSVSDSNAMEIPTSRPSPLPTVQASSAPSISDSNAPPSYRSERPSSAPTVGESVSPSVKTAIGDSGQVGGLPAAASINADSSHGFVLATRLPSLSLVVALLLIGS